MQIKNKTSMRTAGIIISACLLYMASAGLRTVFGVVFLSHQVGSFFSAWIGGVSVEMTGDYILVWAVAVVLSAIAAIAAFKIKEK